MTPSAAVLITVLLTGLPAALFFIYPPAEEPGRSGDEYGRRFIRRAGRGGVFAFACFAALLLIGRSKYENAALDFTFVLAAVSLTMYLAAWLRYFLGGRRVSSLKKTLLFFPFPVISFGALTAVFISLWLGYALPLAPAVMFILWIYFKNWDGRRPR